MSIVTCPKCKSPNDDAQFSGSWMVCAICSNRWFPSAATIDSLPTTEIPQPRPGTPKATTKAMPSPAVRAGGSGEYLPDEPDTDAVGNRALTGRVDGRASGRLAPVIQDGLRSTPEPLPQPGPQSPGPKSPGRPPAAGRPPPATHDPETGPTIDSDLFDRLEEQAQYNRSQMKTIPEIVFDDPAKYRTSVPDSDQSEKVACPVCGHAYAATGKRQGCPQCGTVYDEDSQRIAVGLGEKDNLLGRTLRGCLIDRKLGEGGMGAVYHANQLSLDRSVAVKVLPVDLARNKNFIQRFEREAKSLARINHPNILQIYDFGDDQALGLYFMIIEFVEGLDLGEVLNRRGLLGQIEVLDLLRQAVSGLEAAAEKGVIHRDIKPDNLMIGSNGLVKVSDFGLAKGYVAQVGVTAAGVRVGTPAFMSPEQCDGVEVDFRSDVYNLGATAFLCLTGRLPFDGETPFAIMLKHKTEAVPSLCAIDPTINPGVDALISRMLAKKPEARCTNLRELLEAIEDLESSLAGTDSVLRKSRGPFKALMGGASPMAVPGKAHLGVAPIAPLPIHDQVEVVDLPAVTQIPPTPAAPPSLRGSSGELRRGFDLPAALPPTPLDLAAAPVVEKASPRQSRKLDAELSQARERGRRSQLDLAVANAERLASAGRWVEASEAFLAAADLADAEQQQILRARAVTARRRAAVMRVGRRFGLIVLLAGGIVASVWLATPPVHNWWATQRLQVLIDGLASIPQARQRITALREFADSNSKPWAWYVAAFHRTYQVTASVAAQAAIADIERTQPKVPEPDKDLAPSADVAGVLAMFRDSNVPWEMVAQKSAEVLAAAKARNQVSAQINAVADAARQAESELADQRVDLARVQAARLAGDHVRALDLAAAFRARHTRAGATLRQLPLPARVRIEVLALEIPGDLQVRVDGQTIRLAQSTPAASGAPALEGMVCRNAEKETSLEVTASGFSPLQQLIPASTSLGEKLAQVTFRPAPVWSVTFANPSATASLVAWVRLHPVAGALVIQHREGFLAVGLTDGAEVSRYLRTTPNSPVFVPLWVPQSGNRVAIAEDDGNVELIGSTNLQVEQGLHHGRGEVLAWSPIDLVLQNGRQIHVAIERQINGSGVLVAQDAVNEYWRYSNLKLGSQVPVMIRHDDRLYVFDESSLHLLEEDGKVVNVWALPGPRIGDPADLPAAAGRRDLLVPLTTGIKRLQFGAHRDPVGAIADKVLEKTPGQLAVEGDSALIVSDRQATVLRFTPGAPGATAQWTQPQARPLGAPPTLTATYAATVDDQGTMTVRARGTGEVVQRIIHGVPPAGPLVIMELPNGPAVIIGDRNGQVTAYAVKR
jgi:serine/threonine protein kinase